MYIEASITHRGEPFKVTWTGKGDGHPEIRGEATPLDLLLAAQERHQGTPIGLPGYPLNYRDALSDPTGFMALCYVVSEGLPHFLVLEDSNGIR